MERRNLAGLAAGAMLFAVALGLTTSAALAADGKAGPKAGMKPESAPSPAPARSDAATMPAQALEEGWPDTPAGRVASGWVRAFSGGVKPMREFLEHQVTKKSLSERPMAQRIENYLAMRERLGDLTLHSVVESAPHRLTVVLLADDAQPHRFVFAVEDVPPHRLVQVGMMQTGHGHGHGGHGPK